MGREELIEDITLRVNNMRRIKTLLDSKQCQLLFDTSPVHLIERATKLAQQGDIEGFREWLESHPNKPITCMKRGELRKKCQQAGIADYWNLRVEEMREALLKDKVKVRDGFIAVNSAVSEEEKAECVPFLIGQINNVLKMVSEYNLVCHEVMRPMELFDWSKSLWQVCSAYSKLIKSKDQAYWDRCSESDDEIVALNRRRTKIRRMIQIARLPEGVERFRYERDERVEEEDC